MNSTVYVFGTEIERDGSHFFQYHNDYTVNVFRRYENYLQGDTLLALYRNDNLSYHVYLKRVDNGYIGFCASFNSVWVNNSKDLLKVFEETFVDIVTQGVFVIINDRGKLLSKISRLATCIHEAEDICAQLTYRLGRLEYSCSHLPPVNLAIEASTIKRLPDKPSDKDWAQAIEDYRSMFANYSSSGTKGQFYLLLNKIETLSSERDVLKEQNTKLEERFNQIERQKKQYKSIIILITLLLIGGIITALLISKKNDDINYLEEEVEALESRINLLSNENQEKSEKLAFMTETNNRLEETIQQKNNEIVQLESAIGRLESSISSVGTYYPLIIEKIEIGNTDYDSNIQTDYGNIIYSSQTMYLKPKIYYTGLVSGDMVLKVKWFTPNGELSTGNSSPPGFSQSDEYYIYSGEDNTKVLRGWGSKSKGHWKSGTYRIEVWYKDACLKAKTFKIY